MDKQDLASLATDVGYALRQLRQFRDVDRAIDALERVAERLALATGDDEGIDLASLPSPGFGELTSCPGRRPTASAPRGPVGPGVFRLRPAA